MLIPVRFRSARRIAPFLLASLLGLLAAGAASCASDPKLPAAGSTEADKFLFDRGTEELAAHHWIEEQPVEHTIIPPGGRAVGFAICGGMNRVEVEGNADFGGVMDRLPQNVYR